MKIGDTIYADYQAATPLDPRVKRVMYEGEDILFANPHSADHLLGWNASNAISKAAINISRYFGLSEDEIIFTSGASEANTMAIAASNNYAKHTNRNQILIGGGDHKSIMTEAERSTLNVIRIGLGDKGYPQPEDIKKLINSDTSLVSVIAVNNENGAITELKKIGEICEQYGVLFHADLSQAPLAMDIDIHNFKISLATVSSHKLYGPKGVGALLVPLEMKKWLSPVIAGGGQQDGYRGGTIPTSLCIGFSAAIKILEQEGIKEREKTRRLRDLFVSNIEQLGLGTLIGDLKKRHPGNALIYFPNWEASDLLQRMQPDVAAASQSACSSGHIEPSHVLQAMGISEDKAKACIRFSFGRYTDDHQINQITKILDKTLKSDVR